MGKYKTTFSSEWQESYRWLRKCSDKFSAKCAICNLTFRIDNAGLCQVKSHEKSKKHVASTNILAGNSSQSTIRTGINSEIQLSKGKIYAAEFEKNTF